MVIVVLLFLCTTLSDIYFEGDLISVTTERELAEAVASAKQALLRLYIKPQTTKTAAPVSVPAVEKVTEPKEPTKPSFKPVHAAICDNCDARIVGIRFKCAICPDYDLVRFT